MRRAEESSVFAIDQYSVYHDWIVNLLIVWILAFRWV